MQCQNIVYVLNDNKITPPKPKMLEGLTEGIIVF